MTQRPIEIMRAASDAFRRGDWDGFLALVHPDMEWQTTGLFIEAGTFRGHRGVREYIGAIEEEFEAFDPQLADPVELGELLVVGFRTTAVGRRSKAPVELTFTSVASFKDGKIHRIRNFVERPEALAYARELAESGR